MNILDVVIILIILFGGVIGFKRGFTSSLVSAAGFLLVFVFAYCFKNPISSFLYENLPFFDFGILKGIPILNIILYEMIAFILVLSILMFILKLILIFTKIFEKLLNMTIILGIPSKILGAIIGLIEYFIITFIIVYVVNLPVFNFDFVKSSKYSKPILNNTPILSGQFKNHLNVFNEFASLKDKYKDQTSDEFNLETLDLMLKYDVVDVDSIEKLVNKDKLSIKNIDSVLDKYR